MNWQTDITAIKLDQELLIETSTGDLFAVKAVEELNGQMLLRTFDHTWTFTTRRVVRFVFITRG